MENRNEAKVRTVVHAGDRVRLELQYSEVCMHMRVAGKVMTVELVETGCYCGCRKHSHMGNELACAWCAVHGIPNSCQSYRPRVVAQLLNDDGSLFSAPILTCEAGIYGGGSDGDMFCYPVPAPTQVTA